MPNAQTHLVSACTILENVTSAGTIPWMASGIARSSFLLGAISPDVRAVSGHSREATHFLRIPPPDDRAAPEVMLAQWPELQDTTSLERDRAAFVAGYMTHLVMDQAWVEMIVMPGLFVKGVAWGTDHPNWRLYSILMTYLEYRAAACLPEHAVPCLIRANPHDWLPFIKDKHLVQWRDHVAQVIQKGGARVISRMFAYSNRLEPKALEAIVTSEKRMSAEAYPVIPRKNLITFEVEATRRSQEAVMCYLEDVRYPSEEGP